MDTRITNRKPPGQPRGVAALPVFPGATDPRPADVPASEHLLHDAPVALALGCGVAAGILMLFLAHARLAALLPRWPW